MYILETKRLLMRNWRDNETDRKSFHELWSNPKIAELMLANGPMSQAESDELFEKELFIINKFGVQCWPFFLKDNETFIGTCGLQPYKLFEGIFEFKVQLLPEYWNQSYGYEMGKSILDYSFNTLNLRNLFANHCPSNSPASTLFKKLGFRFSHNEFNHMKEQMHQSYVLNYEELISL
jgi:RimJ/RimL family protein N-acetyltransferase